MDWKKIGAWLLFAAVFCGVSYLALYQASLRRLDAIGLSMTGLSGWLAFVRLLVSVLMLLYLLFQAVLVCRYKPTVASGDELPGCTVVVPAYNEGSAVAETLRSVLRSDYPEGKLEIIAVNDGSSDDTWNWIKLVSG